MEEDGPALARWLVSESANAILAGTLIDRDPRRVGNDRRARVAREWKHLWVKEGTA